MRAHSFPGHDLGLRPGKVALEVVGAELWRLQVPLGRRVGHFRAERNTSENLVVRIVGADGAEGFGEGVPREYVTGENIDGAGEAARSVLPLLAGKRWQTTAELLRDLVETGRTPLLSAHPSVQCAIELALLDCAGKTWGMSVTEMLGGPCRTEVEYSAVIPFLEPELLEAVLGLVRAQKIGHVKVKVGGPRDEDTVASARRVLGEEVSLRLDANEAWDPASAIERLGELAAYGIVAVEQPVPKADWGGLKEVKDAVPMRVIADESLVTLADAWGLADRRACGGFNLRISKCGGLLAVLRIYRFARNAGIPCQLGCHVGETGILSAAGRHFAAVVPELLFAEGSFNRHLLAEDIVEEDLTFGFRGRAPVLDASGLGVTIKRRALEQYCRDRISCF